MTFELFAKESIICTHNWYSSQIKKIIWEMEDNKLSLIWYLFEFYVQYKMIKIIKIKNKY